APVGPETLVVAVSQTGETADTIGAVKAARQKGCPILAVTNVVGSALAREATGVLQMHAGPEIGVASTKAFSTMIVAGYLLGLWLGRQRGALTAEDVRKHIQDLVEIPRLVEKTLELDQPIAALARLFHQPRDLHEVLDVLKRRSSSTSRSRRSRATSPARPTSSTWAGACSSRSRSRARSSSRRSRTSTRRATRAAR